MACEPQQQPRPEPIALLYRDGKGCRQYTFDTVEELAAWAARKPYREEHVFVMPMHRRQFLGKERMQATKAAEFVAKAVNTAAQIEKTAASLASTLLHQAERENEECAYWFIRALSKIVSTRPNMRAVEILDFARTAMPGAAAAYSQYAADKS
jgi:hypothetical protein